MFKEKPVSHYIRQRKSNFVTKSVNSSDIRRQKLSFTYKEVDDSVPNKRRKLPKDDNHPYERLYYR